MKKTITRTTTQWRRRRPTVETHTRQSRTSFSAVLIGFVVALADLSTADSRTTSLSPLSLGLRSALGRSLIINTWGSSRHPRQQQQRATIDNQDDDDEDDEVDFIESAFLRSSHQASQMRVVEPAFLRKGPAVTEDNTSELEFLESALGRSSLSTVTPASSNLSNLPLPEVSSDDDESSSPIMPAPIESSSAIVSLNATPDSRGGAAAAPRSLAFWENMICGAISRTVAQTIMHPANTMKTILQNARGPDRPTLLELSQPKNFKLLTRGAGANLVLSVPHGAVNFAVLEMVRRKLGSIVKTNNPNFNEEKWGAGLDFLSSSIATITCSVVSTPQMMITDNIMAGTYPNLFAATTGLARARGVAGFYAGWWPGLAGKIPSYSCTWALFQQLKAIRNRWSDRPATNLENSIMGCVASATTVSLLIPMDTIKTRLVTQAGLARSEQAYKGIIDCAVKVFREEGIGTFYRGLPPRLVSVVPMIGIQFGVYEFMKRTMLKRNVSGVTVPKQKKKLKKEEPEPEPEAYGPTAVLEEAMMEVAASPEQPFPAPQFLKRFFKNGKDKKKKSLAR